MKGNTERLETLAMEMLARGLSVRDIEHTFRDKSGAFLLSRTAMAEIGERLWEDYLEFPKRDLSQYDIVYMLVDDVSEQVRPK